MYHDSDGDRFDEILTHIRVRFLRELIAAESVVRVGPESSGEPTMPERIRTLANAAAVTLTEHAVARFDTGADRVDASHSDLDAFLEACVARAMLLDRMTEALDATVWLDAAWRLLHLQALMDACRDEALSELDRYCEETHFRRWEREMRSSGL